jgi:hypothetical protein
MNNIVITQQKLFKLQWIIKTFKKLKLTKHLNHFVSPFVLLFIVNIIHLYGYSLVKPSFGQGIF